MKDKTALTARQKRFVEKYLACGDGPEAAIAAGYSPATAEERARELLRDPAVQRCRRESEQRLFDAMGVSSAWIGRRLVEIVDRCMQAIISGNSTLSVSFRSSRSTNHPLAASACAAQYSSGRSTVYPLPGMMSTCLPVSVFLTRFLPHGVTAGVTFFVVGCVPFLPMLCLIRLFVCSVRLGRSLWPASFPVLHARRRRLQSFPSVHHALVAKLRTDLLRRFRARSGRQQHRGHARLSAARDSATVLQKH